MEDNIIEEVTLEKEQGKVNISDDVVATIAGIAATEIDGVASMSGSFAGGIAEKFGAKKNGTKGVKVTVTPDGATLELYITVKFGVRIPELAWDVQENVKNSVETMTGINVLAVNVHIDNVSFDKEQEKKPDKKQEQVKEVKDSDIEDNAETVTEE